ncbi:MAG TPA: hypothetical protein DHN33_03265, partial [Eubacteriaceae bacterium]|nr:hypothetical protein [Eubacteriaceae bacterium]
DSEKTLIVEYTLEDVVVVHNDVAELYWSFVGEDWENHLGFVEVNMILPGSSEELRVFAHGPLHGNSELVNDQQARLTIEGLNAGEAVDGRLIFSPNLAASAVKQTDMEALDGILEAEGARAEEANRAREADQRRTT